MPPAARRVAGYRWLILVLIIFCCCPWCEAETSCESAIAAADPSTAVELIYSSAVSDVRIIRCSRGTLGDGGNLGRLTKLTKVRARARVSARVS
jgi:hypothetical protein